MLKHRQARGSMRPMVTCVPTTWLCPVPAAAQGLAFPSHGHLRKAPLDMAVVVFLLACPFLAWNTLCQGIGSFFSSLQALWHLGLQKKMLFPWKRGGPFSNCMCPTSWKWPLLSLLGWWTEVQICVLTCSRGCQRVFLLSAAIDWSGSPLYSNCNSSLTDQWPSQTR